MLYAIIKTIVKILLKIFYHLKVYGSENYIKGPAFIASNHASYLDPAIAAVSFPEPIHFLGRSSLYKNKLFGKLILKLQCHPVTQGTENSAALKAVLNIIKNNEKVYLCPEGTRTKTGEIQPGLVGIGLMVLKSKAPVIPLYIHGSYDIWSVHRKKPKIKGKLVAIFGTPLFFDNLSIKDPKQAREHIVSSIMSSITSLKTWYESGCLGKIP